jgi:uncharacterized Zn ribbon protein
MVECLSSIGDNKCHGKYVYDKKKKLYVCDTCGNEIDEELFEMLLAMTDPTLYKFVTDEET